MSSESRGEKNVPMLLHILGSVIVAGLIWIGRISDRSCNFSSVSSLAATSVVRMFLKVLLIEVTAWFRADRSS